METFIFKCFFFCYIILLRYDMGDDMRKRFYISIFVILSLSVVVLSATYSKDSGTSEYVAINKDIDNLKVTYEHGELLDITKVNKLSVEALKGSNISIVNKNKVKANVLIELNYLGDDEVYYSIDNSNMRLIVDNAKEVVSLNEFGTEGDQKVFNIKVFSLHESNDKVSINISTLEDGFLKSNLVNDQQVYKDKDGNYIYYGKPNNYIKYNNKIYRIIGLINNKFKLLRFTEELEDYREDNSYLQLKDFLRTFNNIEVDESNMDIFDTWLKEYNNYWFQDGTVYIDNTINVEKIGQHKKNEVIEISDYILLNGGDGTINNPYEVKYES